MRIKITLLPDKERALNINYNYFLSAWIYDTLQKANKEYADELHSKGYNYGRKTFKLFTFSQLRCKNVRVVQNYITFLDETVLYVSSPKKEFLLNFVSEVLEHNILKVQDYEYKIKRVEIVKDPEFDEENKFICLSPIVTSTVIEEDGDKKGINLPLDDLRFKENLKNNLIEKYYVLYNTLPGNLNVNINFDMEYFYKNPKGKRIQYKNIFIKGYMVPFTMSGNKDLIKVAYECGIGEKNSGGFGMIQKL